MAGCAGGFFAVSLFLLLSVMWKCGASYGLGMGGSLIRSNRIVGAREAWSCFLMIVPVLLQMGQRHPRRSRRGARARTSKTPTRLGPEAEHGAEKYRRAGAGALEGQGEVEADVGRLWACRGSDGRGAGDEGGEKTVMVMLLMI